MHYTIITHTGKTAEWAPAWPHPEQAGLPLEPGLLPGGTSSRISSKLKAYIKIITLEFKF